MEWASLRPRCLLPTLSIVAAQTAADSGSAIAVGVAECMVSRHTGLPLQWWEMCRRIHVFNVGRQAGSGIVQYLHCEAWKLELCDVCFGLIFNAEK